MMRERRVELSLVAIALTVASVGAGLWVGYESYSRQRYQALLDFRFSPNSRTCVIGPQAPTSTCVREEPDLMLAELEKDFKNWPRISHRSPVQILLNR